VSVLPGTRFVLVEAQRRRAAFLRSALTQLEADADVLEARAEDVGRQPELRASFDAAVARSFGSPAVTAECAAPLLRIDGVLVVSDPPVGGAARWPADGLDELGLVVDHQTTEPAFTRLRKCAATPDRYPRSVGRPAKRPLW
jgi:16S rRNA (guanine527-N7)-methyltransferase